MASDLSNALSFARRAARRAGVAAMAQSDASENAGDISAAGVRRAAHAVIEHAIRESHPGDAILSPETESARDRLGANRVWLVDALDGGNELATGSGEFSIMIGLAIGGEAVLGVVYVPDGDRMYAAARGLGATVEVAHETQGLRTDRNHWPPRMVASRAGPAEATLRIQEALDVTDVAAIGSVGVGCALIAEGKRDVYVHPAGDLQEWETCAPEVLLREAGGEVVDCLGEPLRYNKPDTHQPHGILACAPRILERAKHVVRDAYESDSGTSAKTAK